MFGDMRNLIALAALILAPLALAAQPAADDADEAATNPDQAAADSLVATSNGLFNHSLTTKSIRPQVEVESRKQMRLRPADWSPAFPVPFRRADLLGLEDTPPLLVSYDRADGLYLGVGANSPARMLRERRLQGYVGFGYAFGSHYWQALGGFAVDLLDAHTPLRVGTEGHIITDTRDAWKMAVDENSFAALLAGQDNRDYFQRSGFSMYVRKFLTPRIGLGVEYRMDNYTNSKREIGWSLFGPSQPFAEVPAVREGNMSSLLVNLTVDYMAMKSWDAPQFGLEAQAEFGTQNGAFETYVVDARLKTTVVRDLAWLAVHARLGSSTGNAPPQRRFTVGGNGTLPGFPFDAFEGNRMLLLQTDLLIAPIKGVPLRIILSNDFATIANTAHSSGALAGFLENVEDILYSPGIYMGTATGVFRIGYAFRTDVFADPRLVIRVARPF